MLVIVGSISIHFINKDSKTIINLTEQQKLEDYEYLWRTLRESYPFMGVAERLGIDAEEIYERYKSEILKTKTDIDFAKLLNYTVNEFNGIGHLSMIDGEKYKFYKDAYAQYIESDKEVIKGYNYWKSELENPTTQKTYSLLDDRKRGFRTNKHLKKIKEEISYNHYSLLKLSENNRPYLEGLYNEEDIQAIPQLPNFKNLNSEDVANMSNFVKDEYIISPNKASRTYKGSNSSNNCL